MTWQRSLVPIATTAIPATKLWPNNSEIAPSNPLCPWALDKNLLTVPVVQIMAPSAAKHMDVFDKHQIISVVHVGANVGEELEKYVTRGVKNVMFFEPRPSAFELLVEKAERFKPYFANLILHNCALGTHNGIIDMHLASNGQSSSILKPKLHLESHPEIRFAGTEQVKIIRGDSIVPPNLFIDLLHVDVQGYELEVFKGLGDRLNHVRLIETESNIRELYEGCSLVEQVDNYLQQYGFTRTFTPDMSLHGWGDCIYERLP